MDSGNSGSMQSSSGGDEEYDSRTDAFSPFLNPSAAFGSISSHHQPPPSAPAPPTLAHHPTSTTFFDPSTQGSLGPPLSANSLFNLDLVWSGRSGLGSEPNYAQLGNLAGFPSSTQSLPQGPSQGPFTTASLHSADGNGGRPAPAPVSASASASAAVVRSDQPTTARNSRKRTRASRRAPTTVLTTDTTNFRQMVQDYTGIPGPPLSASSPYARRLDLFAAAGSALRSSEGLYPFRPSAQKVSFQSQPSPFVVSSSTSSMVANNSNSNRTANFSDAFGASTSNNSYQISSDLNPQSPMMSFQSLLQSSKANSGNNNTIPYMEELGMNILPDDDHVNANLGGGFGRRAGQQLLVLGSFDGNGGGGGGGGGGSGGGAYKLNNCAGTTSEFHPEKGLEFLKD